MAQRRLTRQELNRRRRRSGFVGRERELARFRENLGRDPQDRDFRYLFHVHGNGGIGKTSLIRQWDQAAREAGAVTVTLSDDVQDPVEAMEAIAGQLARQGLELRTFEKRLRDYRQRRHEVESAQATLGQEADHPGAPPGTFGTPAPAASPGTSPGEAAPPASVGGTLAAQAALSVLGTVPGVGALTGPLDPQQVARLGSRARVAVSSRLRGHEDVQLVVAPLKVLTPVFLADLAEVARRQTLLVLFFDVYERTGPVLDTWLRDVVCEERHGSLEANVVVVLSGQGRLNPRHWADWADLVTETPLEVFTDEEARELLTARGVTDEATVEVVLQLSGRLPVLVDMLAQPHPASPGEVVDGSETAVERFLKWEHDPARRAAALSCALPLRVDEDVCAVLAPEGAADRYAWLRGLPFVSDDKGRGRYHDVVRDLMLRLQRTQSPSRWAEQHTRLADAFRERRLALEEAIAEDERWRDAEWREQRLNETYHRLCAAPRQALTPALEEAAAACDHGLATLRRWAGILRQAGRDADSSTLAEWGERLSENPTTAGDPPGDGTGDAAGEPPADAVRVALTHLLAHTPLSPSARARILTFRARRHNTVGRYEQTVDDASRALALDPESVDAYYERGRAHWRLGRFEDAVADHRRVLETVPGHTRALAHQGDALRCMGNHDEAVAVLNRALEHDPEYAWALGCRGVAYFAMERYEEALADLDRAVDLDPRYTWAFALRGMVHRRIGRYEEALADFDRALDLDPAYVWAFAHRGELHSSLERYDPALGDLNSAVDLDPRYTWALAQRGRVHRKAGRYEEALADFDRALDLNPEDPWPLAQRGVVHRETGRYEEALADFDRALDLGPEGQWIVNARGLAYHQMGRWAEALADYDRALALDPEDPWPLAQCGHVHLARADYERAVRDYDRALDLGYDRALWTHTKRGEAHLLLGDLDAARRDLARAAELGGADVGWSRLLLALVHRRAGDPAEEDAWREAETAFAASGGPDGEPGGEPDDVGLGNLFLLRCLRAEWDGAATALDRFLQAPPQPWTYREAANLLDRLGPVAGVDPARLAPLRERLLRSAPPAPGPSA
ncbi:tetratricopeptide repeat protein [Streptomyces sp. 4N509B]|uniref:tetratricopeptide repeat protein n=1 Tax=Streptomyces sp. 4N509B TaxID=3457413 RepID=UPI003FD1F9E3